MSKIKVSMQRRSTAPARALKRATPGARLDEILLFDNEDQTYTISGVDAGGNQIDIATVATLAVVSSDPSVLSVDTPSGMTIQAHALKPGSTTLGIDATWNDGSVGPFHIDWPQTVGGTAVTGLVVTPGTPVVR